MKPVECIRCKTTDNEKRLRSVKFNERGGRLLNRPDEGVLCVDCRYTLRGGWMFIKADTK